MYSAVCKTWRVDNIGGRSLPVNIPHDPGTFYFCRKQLQKTLHPVK